MTILYTKHELYPESILIRNFTGVVTVDDIISSWENLLEHNLIGPSTKGVINNLTNSELDMNMGSFEKLIGYLKEQEVFKHVKLAVISTNPKFIVFPTIGLLDVHELKIKPFSTLESAEHWIINS